MNAGQINCKLPIGTKTGFIGQIPYTWGERIAGAVGLLIASVCCLPALYQWTLALYRLHLYLDYYHREPFMNHADDFQGIYVMDTYAVPMGLLAVVLLWRFKSKPRTFALVVLAANLLGAVCFAVMHRMGVLVTYDEFIWQWQH